MKGRPSGWQWISKLKLEGNLVSMETPGEVVWAMLSDAFSEATEKCGGQDRVLTMNQCQHMSPALEAPMCPVEHFHSLPREVHGAHWPHGPCTH